MSDSYLAVVQKHWSDIRDLYMVFESKKPVMLYDIQTKKIFAYPYAEFKADLNKRSQDLLERAYALASNDGQMVVFVRDNENRKLVSYVMELDAA